MSSATAKRWFVLPAMLSILLMTSFAVSQTPRSSTPEGQQLGPEIPESALSTERGRRLAERLRYLRRSEANMGAKHPALPGVREEIDRVLEQLRGWVPDETRPSAGTPLGRVVPNMSDQELRRLILRMSLRIEDLEERVRALELRRRQIH